MTDSEPLTAALDRAWIKSHDARGVPMPPDLRDRFRDEVAALRSAREAEPTGCTCPATEGVFAIGCPVHDPVHGAATQPEPSRLREALRLLERGKTLEARDLLRATIGHLPSKDATAALLSTPAHED